jgi:hypothetical protein
MQVIFFNLKNNFMKKILFVMILLVFHIKPIHAQGGPDYANYHLVYYDEFDYNTTTFQADSRFTSPSFTTSGVEYGNWHVCRPTDWAEGAGYWKTDQVTMPSVGKIRLTANRITREHYYYPTACTDPGIVNHGGGSWGSDNFPSGCECGVPGYVNCTDIYRDFVSGMLILGQNVGPYGIMEIKMTIPPGQPFSSFYMDNGNQSILPMEGMFGSGPGSTWSAHFTSEGWTIAADYGPSQPPMTLNVYHLYTVQWTPDEIKFYLDGVLIADVPFTTGRSTYSGIQPKIDLATNPESWGGMWTEDGIFMDIDYVKIWTMNCQDEDYNVNAYTTSGNITPGLYKYAKIESASSIVTSTISNDATVFEASSTILSPNFLADESVYTTITQIVNGPRVITRCNNGYFLVLPNSCPEVEPCTLGPISGPSTICFNPDPTETFTFTNATSSGIWESDNPNVIIDPGTGIIDASTITTGSGTVTISYIFNGCSVAKIVNIVNCSLGPKSHPTTNVTSIVKTDDITVSPNPTQNTITISYPCQSAGQLEINIKNVAGQVVYTESVACSEGNNAQQVVDMSTFAAGIYFVDLTLNEQHVVKKVVKL